MGKLPSPTGGRSIEEWIGKTPDSPIPDKVKLRIFLRHDGRCYLTQRVLRKGEYDFDHIKRLADGGTHSEGNLAPVWRPKHREKTAEENSAAAKADRIRRKHIGLWPKSKSPLKGRGFAMTRGELSRLPDFMPPPPMDIEDRDHE